LTAILAMIEYQAAKTFESSPKFQSSRCERDKEEDSPKEELLSLEIAIVLIIKIRFCKFG